MFKTISIVGAVKSGKDTFCDHLQSYLTRLGYSASKVAFANSLKAELFDLITYNFGFSPFTKNREQKEIIRPILIAYGNAKRKISKGSYWVDRLKESLELLHNELDVVLLSDLRFCEYGDSDEVGFAKSNNGIIIYLERIEDGKIIQPYDNTEYENNEKLKQQADFHVTWGDSDTPLEEFVKNFTDKSILPCLRK